MRGIRKVAIAVLAVALVIAGAAFAWRRLSRTPVEVYPVYNLSGWWGEGDTLSGMVSEGQTQRVILREADVVSVNVEEGDVVRAGDVLMVYDTTSFEITMLNDKAHIAVAEADLAMARREIARLQGLAPSEEAPEPTVETIDNGPLNIQSVVDKGTKPESDGDSGMVFLVGPDTKVTAEFLRWLRDSGKSCELRIYKDDVYYGSWLVEGPSLPDVTVVYEEWTPPTPEPEPDPEPDPDPGSDPAPDDPSGDDPSGGDSSGDDPSGGGADDPGAGDDGATTATHSGGSSASAFEIDETLYVRREVEAITDDWRIGNGLSFSSSGVSFAPGSVTTYGTLVSSTPERYERYEEVVHEFVPSGDDYAYSRSELAGMIREQQESIRRLELDLREAQITYQQDLLVGANGEVTAQVSGVVTYVEDPSIAKPGDKFIEVKGEESYSVTLYVNELGLDGVAVGDEYEVTAYESGSTAYARVTDVGNVPVEGGFGYSEANPNSSWYPVTVVVEGGPDDGIEMVVGEYCEATPVASDDSAQASAIVISQMFVRKDDRGSYVMVDDGTGHLERRAVTTGRIIWGTEVEVTSGLAAEDLIAFPYGKDVVEGAPTVEKDYPEY